MDKAKLDGRKKPWTESRKRSRSISQRGKNNSNFKGRMKIRGYWRVYMPNHPYTSSQKYVREHRLVMERHLGRILLPTELVHHINGDIEDNRIENLMLFSRSEHMRYHRNKYLAEKKCQKQ